MKFVQKMSKEAYKKLIEYALKTCDSFSLCRYEGMERITDIQRKNFELITSNKEFTKQKLLENYSEKFLDKIYNTYKDDERIHFNMLLQPSPLYKRLDILDGVELFVFQYKTEKFLEKYKNLLLEKIPVDDCVFYDKNGKKLETGNYKLKYKLNRKTAEFLINNANNVYDFIYPKNMEDLCIYNNGTLWLDSVAHEKECVIFCTSNDEYELLKSFGIKFRE